MNTLNPDMERKIDALLRQMTLTEKVSLLSGRDICLQKRLQAGS